MGSCTSALTTAAFRLSGTTRLGTPPQLSKARRCRPIQASCLKFQIAVQCIAFGLVQLSCPWCGIHACGMAPQRNEAISRSWAMVRSYTGLIWMRILACPAFWRDVHQVRADNLCRDGWKNAQRQANTHSVVRAAESVHYLMQKRARTCRSMTFDWSLVTRKFGEPSSRGKANDGGLSPGWCAL
jgi:hypothetical protein